MVNSNQVRKELVAAYLGEKTIKIKMKDDIEFTGIIEHLDMLLRGFMIGNRYYATCNIETVEIC